MVSRSLPEPPTNGGRQRTHLLYRALTHVGRVDLLLLPDHLPASDSTEAAKLQRDYHLAAMVEPWRRGRFGPWRWVRPLAPALVDRLAHNLGRKSTTYQPSPNVRSALQRLLRANAYDLIVARYLMSAARSGALDAGLPVIVDVDDLDTQTYVTRLSAPGTRAWQRMVLRMHLRQLQRLIPKLLGKADHLWLAGEEDRGLIEHRNVSVLANIPFEREGEAPPPLEPSPADSQIVLIVAAMNHRVNVEGVDWFVREVWPRVRRPWPGAELHLVGSHMSDQLKAQWNAHEGVSALGFVESLSEAYRTCAFTVVPLFEGGGSKIKVLESLRFGRTTVVTSHSLRGYGDKLRHHESLLVADEPESLASACAALLGSAERRDRLARRGWELVREHWSWPRFQQQVQDGIRSVLVKGSGI